MREAASRQPERNHRPHAPPRPPAASGDIRESPDAADNEKDPVHPGGKDPSRYPARADIWHPWASTPTAARHDVRMCKGGSEGDRPDMGRDIHAIKISGEDRR